MSDILIAATRLQWQHDGLTIVAERFGPDEPWKFTDGLPLTAHMVPRVDDVDVLNVAGRLLAAVLAYRDAMDAARAAYEVALGEIIEPLHAARTAALNQPA